MCVYVCASVCNCSGHRTTLDAILQYTHFLRQGLLLKLELTISYTGVIKHCHLSITATILTKTAVTTCDFPKADLTECWPSLIEGAGEEGWWILPAAHLLHLLPSVQNPALITHGLMTSGGLEWKINRRGDPIYVAVRSYHPCWGKNFQWCVCFAVTHSPLSDPSPMLCK